MPGRSHRCKRRSGVRGSLGYPRPRCHGPPPPRHRARSRSCSPRPRRGAAADALARRHLRGGVQFTPHGPVALNVLTGPRPGGTTTLAPVLSNDTLTGRETLTAMQRRLAGVRRPSAGVNGDFFSLRDRARRAAILMRDGQVASPPYGAARAPGVLTDGTLDVRRVSFFGTWQGAGAKRTLNGSTSRRRRTGSRSSRQAWGAATPALPGRPRRRSCSRSRPPSRTPTCRRRSSRCGRGGRAGPDPARRRRPRRRRLGGGGARGRGAWSGQQVTVRA